MVLQNIKTSLHFETDPFTVTAGLETCAGNAEGFSRINTSQPGEASAIGMQNRMAENDGQLDEIVVFRLYSRVMAPPNGFPVRGLPRFVPPFEAAFAELRLLIGFEIGIVDSPA